MKKAEPQHGQSQNQPAARQGGRTRAASPQGGRIAQLEAMMDGSPRQAAQRRKFDTLFGTAQRAGDDEALQRKLKTTQRLKDEEPLQGKLATAQRVEDEEPLQGKLETAQRAEDEEPLQGKLATAQRAEDEEPLQGKLATAQRVEDEEPLQRKFATAQRIGDEEPLQGKFSSASPTQLEQQPAKDKPNNTGLPDNLKSGIENLSGLSMDSVKVHYNSSQPAQLNALAYAQGTDIHVAPGQEQHLPHEAWHVVQQAQGRVRPTLQMKGGVPVNDDKGLEHEADVMGGKAVAQRSPHSTRSLAKGTFNERKPIQRYTEDEDGYKISERKNFAVKNEGAPNSELYVAEGAEPQKLKEVNFIKGGAKTIAGEEMNKFGFEFSTMSEGDVKKIHCGPFSQKLTGKMENVENQTAQPGRSLFVDEIGWEKDITREEMEKGVTQKGNWDNHYAPVIVADGDDRGTFETAVHVDFAWFGIYGKSRAQSFRLKTVVADINLARDKGKIDEKTAKALLDAIGSYAETGSTATEDEYLAKELAKIESLWKQDPDIDSKFREQEAEERKRSEENERETSRIWNELLSEEYTAEMIYQVAVEKGKESSLRSALVHTFKAKSEKELEGKQKSFVQQKIDECMRLIDKPKSVSGSKTEGSGLLLPVLGITAIIGLIAWLVLRKKK